MEIQYIDNFLCAEDILIFQQRMNWTIDPREQWVKALKNTLYSVAAVSDNEVIAMGRLLGDGSIYWYINDVFVLDEYQGMGIGSTIVQKLLTYIKENSISGTEVSICLMCAQGKESFYEKFGFQCRPHAYEGSGMELEIEID
jgi:GNAT superfamily N-acetyltransferase